VQHLEWFERDAGPIDWDPGELARCALDAEVATVLHVAVVLEEDTAISSRQARAFGLDHDADLASFLAAWEQEEAEHARALAHLLAHQPHIPPALRPALAPARRRGVARVPLSAARRLPATGVAFCALGAAAEYLALVVYTELAKRSGSPTVEALLRSIIRQEGRHLAFFKAAAGERAASMSDLQGRLARRIVRTVWAPIGIPSLGEDHWRAALGPLVDDPAVRARVERMDRVLDSIPHLGGMDLMAGFLSRSRPTAPST
jgi:rubrerythrin